MDYLLVPLAYLVGSISSAVLMARLFNMPDPRSVGSGNPGATNILRQGNKTAAAGTLLGDLFKGIIPVVAARMVTDDSVVLALVAAAAFTGHLFPVFFEFKGGKGVATALGVYIALSPWIGLALILTWLTAALVFRYSSLAAMVTAIASPLYAWFLLPAWPYMLMALYIAALLLWRHRSNFQRLLNGEEDKIKFGRG